MGKFKNITDLTADDEVEKEGVELSFGKGRFVTIKRSGSSNRKYKSALARIFKPYLSVSGVISASDDEATDLLKEVYAESVVVGWRGFKDNAGKEMDFSKKHCIELFTEAPEVFEHIQAEAAKFSNFARRDEEEAGK